MSVHSRDPRPLIAWLGVGVLFVCGLLVFISGSGLALAQGPATATPYRVYLPLAAKSVSFPPTATTSRYVSTLDPATLADQGCRAASANQNGVIVLDFGSPRIQGAEYGTRMFGTGSFISTTQIALAAEQFSQGYWNCSSSNAQLTLAIGTTNCGYIPGKTGCNINSTNITAEHGQAWRQMVKQVSNWVNQSGYAARISIGGANDIELNWCSAQETRAWVDGYFSTAPTELFALYNFGACDGCPYLSSQNWVLPNDWTKDDVWYVSEGAWTTYMLPEIYLTNGWNASQWYLMSAWAYTNKSGAINFRGSFTQWQACQDVGGCTSTGNTPTAGWTQLYNALNADTRTAQGLPLATDITWQQ
jgi:hypothetical protein